LKELLVADDQIIKTILHIINYSITPKAAVLKLQEELNLSKMASYYLLNVSLSSLGSLNAEGIAKKLEDYKKQMAAICSVFK
jgi:DNA gyrase/topoisomerase IV subunit A